MSKLRKQSRTVLVVAILVLAVALVLSACGTKKTTGGTTGGGTPKAGGTYNYPLTAEPPSIEPLNAQENQGMQVAHQCFWGLVRYEAQSDGAMLAVPCIASSWDVNSDATVFTFHLRKDAMFGPPVNRAVTADDFLYSWNRATDPANQSVVSYVLSPIVGCDDSGYAPKGLTGVKVIDPQTLQVTLRYSFAEFPQTLGHTVAAPVPKEQVEKLGNKKFGDMPVGTGPYMVQSWQHNQKIVIVKTPNFWDKNNAGYVDTINFPIYNSTNTQWLDFQKGTIDYSSVPPGQVHSSQNMPQVKSGEWTADMYSMLAVSYCGINQKDPVVGGSNGLPLRQAIYAAMNIPEINTVLNEGVDLPATGFVPPGIPGFVANQSPYKYDEAKAKSLMSQIGTVPTLQYWFNTDEANQKMAEALQANWQTVGIKTTLQNFEWGTYLSKLQEAKQQLFRMGWIADYPSMDNFLYPLFQSAQARTGSYTFYNNPQFDQLLIKARSTLDAKQREALYAQAEVMVLTDIAAVPQWWYRDYRVTNNRVKGFQQNAMEFTDMWKVWVD